MFRPSFFVFQLGSTACNVPVRYRQTLELTCVETRGEGLGSTLERTWSNPLVLGSFEQQILSFPDHCVLALDRRQEVSLLNHSNHPILVETVRSRIQEPICWFVGRYSEQASTSHRLLPSKWSGGGDDEGLAI
jgi:hypothetical protein